MSNEKPDSGGKILRHEFGDNGGSRNAEEGAENAKAKVLAFGKEKGARAPFETVSVADLEFIFGEPGVEIREREGRKNFFDRVEGDILLGTIAVVSDEDGGVDRIYYEYGMQAGRTATETWSRKELENLYVEKSQERKMADAILEDLKKVFGKRVAAMRFVASREGKLIFGEFVGSDMISEMEVMLNEKGEVRMVLLEDDGPYDKEYLDKKLDRSTDDQK